MKDFATWTVKHNWILYCFPEKSLWIYISNLTNKVSPTLLLLWYVQTFDMSKQCMQASCILYFQQFITTYCTDIWTNKLNSNWYLYLQKLRLKHAGIIKYLVSCMLTSLCANKKWHFLAAKCDTWCQRGMYWGAQSRHQIVLSEWMRPIKFADNNNLLNILFAN